MQLDSHLLAPTVLVFVSAPSLVVFCHPLFIALARRKGRGARVEEWKKAGGDEQRAATGGKRPGTGEWSPSVAVAVPMAPAEEHLAGNLHAVLGQRGLRDYRVVLTSEDPNDPSAAVAHEVACAHPEVETRITSSGPAGGSIAKMHNLGVAIRSCENEIIVLADSDVRFGRSDELKSVIAPLRDERIGVVTVAPTYRRPRTLGGVLMATMINADLWPYLAILQVFGVLNVTNGAVLAMRRGFLSELGDLEDLQHQLLSDAVLARKVRWAGRRVILAAEPVSIPTPSLSVPAWWRQVMRWHIGMRRVLPRFEYLLFGYHRSPVLLGGIAFLLFDSSPLRPLFLLIPVLARILSCTLVSIRWIPERETLAEIPLAILTDLISPAIWLISWAQRTIVWRGHSYRIGKDGAAEEVARA